MKYRRLRKSHAHLEITAFINLIVVLVPFLLSVAVFTRMSVIDLGLPAQSNSRVEQLKTDHLQLEVVIRPDALEVSDRIGGLIERIPDAAGTHDMSKLRTLVEQLKQKFPTQKDASVLSEPNTTYDALVQVMDTVRSGRAVQDGKIVSAEMFPDISVGDAPLVKTAAR